MQASFKRVRYIPSQAIESSTESQEQILLKSLSAGDRSVFWLLWSHYQDYLYRRCFQWMGSKHTDAEEALSRATLKAWNQLPKYAHKITNLRAWLTRLTHNLCVDMHRESNRGAISMESFEEIALGDSSDSPESALLRSELSMYIRRAINALPSRLRDAFSLRCHQQMSSHDIAQQLGLSVDNVDKRMEQARKILQKRLHKYFSGLDDSSLDSLHPYQFKNKARASSSPAKEEPRRAKKRGKPVGETTQSNQKKNKESSDAQAVIKIKHIVEQINYRVTATCLETLPHAWYNSPTPLGWR
ncbi:MAG: RNA polymerase sigma factor [Symploca sp. SIO3C6]|nr:RNA polymerase sigma factor [Symploca sp. SIO3C6]NER29378.1 RNA polymerase sigma factor [Symploca sp. SIO1C4]NET05636.1 RNA polymerase sigma factor [Symploca sp. SIO2B6]